MANHAAFLVVTVGLLIGCGARSALDVPGDNGGAPADEPPVLYPCPFGFAECDGNPATICETEIAASDDNCGACGTRCPSGLVCGAGRCLAPRAIAEIAVGAFHACARRADGEVLCWGDDEFGQLGVGTPITSRVRPTPVTTLDHVAQISADNWNTCARTEDGRIVCWGSGNYYSLGNGSTENSPVPVDVPSIPDLAAVEVGPFSVIALTREGLAYGWGSDKFGELGDGNTVDSPDYTDYARIPRQLLLQGAVRLTAGSTQCALLRSGHVACWGDNTWCMVGVPTDPEISWQHTVPVPTEVEGTVGAIAVDSGKYTCAVTSDGRLQCWGYGAEVACGSTRQREVPGDTAEVKLGSTMACYRRRSGGVHCWLIGAVDPQDHPSVGSRSAIYTAAGVEADVDNVTDAVGLGVGATHACVLHADGRVSCWGDNSYGQLGDGTAEYRDVPVDVVGLE